MWVQRASRDIVDWVVCASVREEADPQLLAGWPVRLTAGLIRSYLPGFQEQIKILPNKILSMQNLVSCLYSDSGGYDIFEICISSYISTFFLQLSLKDEKVG